MKQGADDLARSVDWAQLTAEEQSNIRAELDKLLLDCPETLGGLRELLGREYSLNMTTGHTNRTKFSNSLKHQDGQKKAKTRIYGE